MERQTGMTRLATLLLVVATISGCASTSQRQGDAADERAALSGLPVASSADEARTLAREAYSKRDLDLTVYLLTQAVEMDPEDAQSMYAIGAIQESKGNTEFAARAYSRAVEVDPSHALAQQQHGTMLLRAGDRKGARKALEAAIKEDATLWRAHDLLGVIADMDEEYDDAIAHYSAAIALRPTAASIVNNRGYSKYLAGRLDAAEADFRLALEIDASHQRAWQNLGLIYARQKKYDQARWAMEMYMPKHVAANDIGYIAMLDGEYDRAAALFEEAILLSPRYYPTAVANQRELERRSRPNGALALREADAAELESLLHPVQVEPTVYSESLPAPSADDVPSGSPQAAVSDGAPQAAVASTSSSD